MGAAQPMGGMGGPPNMMPFMMPMAPMMPTQRGGRNLPPKGFVNMQKQFGGAQKKSEPPKK